MLNDAGQTAFSADLTGSGVDSTNDAGIWSEGSGSLALVARSGDHAPGTPSGVNFSQLRYHLMFAVLNDAGQIAFFASLTGSGVDSTNDLGIWATDRTGALQLIARRATRWKWRPATSARSDRLCFIRHTATTSGTGNSDGRPSGFNNLGQLAF